jgi:hypothetical protein
MHGCAIVNWKCRVRGVSNPLSADLKERQSEILETMRLRTEIRSGDFPAIFDRFEELIGSNLWRRRVVKIRDSIRGNPYLREWLLEENRTAFVLNTLSTEKKASWRLPAVQIQDAHYYETVGFVAQTMADVNKDSGAWRHVACRKRIRTSDPRIVRARM